MQPINTINIKKSADRVSLLADLLPAITHGLTGLLGCWHRQMSRPFTRDGETYRVCLACGARRRFDLDRWKTHGTYYRNLN